MNLPRPLEAVLMVGSVALFIHLMFSRPCSPGPAAGTGAGILLFFFLGRRAIGAESARVWKTICSLGAGLMIFMFLTCAGAARWPMAAPASLDEYAFLLVSHLVLTATLFAAFLWLAGDSLPSRFGVWRDRSPTILTRSLLGLMTGALLFGAVSVMVRTAPSSTGPAAWLAIIAIFKAVLTGATEEVVYRGVLQSLLIRRFGALWGIALQACLYTAFHIHLGPPFLEAPHHLAPIMAAGLFFGLITRITGHIGWAAAQHTAAALVIEWRNLAF